MLAASLPAWGYSETHLNEISAPVSATVVARVAELNGLPSRTRAEKSELAALKKLQKTLGKFATRLSQDVSELATAAAAVKKLGAAGARFAPDLDTGLFRVAIALNEREDFVGDHRGMLTSASERAKLDKSSAAAATARAKADAATDADDRARLLKTAEAKLTKALKLGEKFARRTSKPLPPTRLRSGDAAGPGGARIAVPRGSGTTLDGVSVVFPPGALQALQTITLEEAPDFVGGRDVPAGAAVAVLPSNATLNAPVTVFLRFALPEGTDISDLTVFRKDTAENVPLTGTAIQIDGTVSATTTSLGSFQPGVQAPPIGAPDGTYVVFGCVVITGTGTTTGGPPPFDPVVNTALLLQEFRFRRDRTGTASNGSLSVSGRVFQTAAPHHLETSGLAASSYDFVWTPDAANRFSFTFPFPPSQTVTVQGVASTDGNVVAMTGHGGTYDFVAVGLRPGTLTSAADMAGPWSGVEMGVEFRDAGARPFTTQWYGASRSFDASATGVLTFGAAGSAFTTGVRYRTDLSEPIHERSTAQSADGGTLALQVGIDGSLTTADLKHQGFFAKGQGAFVLGTYDTAAHRVGLLVAAKQSANLPPASATGTWNTVRFDQSATVGVPDARSSTHEFVSRRGTFTADAGGQAEESFDAATRATYTLVGAPPTSGMTWSMSAAAPGETASTSSFALALDAAGNHRPGGAPTWYSFSADGAFVLGALTGADTRATLGIVLGVR